jgi:hypothetical protein
MGRFHTCPYIRCDNNVCVTADTLQLLQKTSIEKRAFSEKDIIAVVSQLDQGIALIDCYVSVVPRLRS